jgi:hypothetical protein
MERGLAVPLERGCVTGGSLMRWIRVLCVVSVFAVPLVSRAEQAAAEKGGQAAAVEKCEHGVKKTLCARCNPKLAAVYKAKGDWCEEHQRPESQCVKCHPELAKQGVK